MLLAIVTCAAAVRVAAARADFTETFCAGGLPSAPWTQGPLSGTSPWLESNDRCAEGGVIGWDTHQNPQPEGRWSTGIEAPPGEVFTHETLSYTTQGSSTGFLFALFGYGPSSILAESKVSATGLSGVVDAGLPDATQIWTRVDCDTADGCPLTLFSNVLAIGGMSLTVHDTGVPAVAPAGGSLAANGTLSADTSLVPDGTYPVILTAYDVSGDPTPVQVSTVTVANHTGILSVPIGRQPKRHGRHHLRPLKVKVTFRWDWRGATTRLDSARFGRLPRGDQIALRCRGPRCPFTRLSSGRRGVRHLQHRLARRVFRPGQKLQVTITAPHHTPERGTMVIQAGALPTVKPTRTKGHRP